MSIQVFEVNKFDLDISTEAFLAELDTFLQRLRNGLFFRMFHYNVTEYSTAAHPNIRNEEPDKNILIGHPKTIPDEISFRESGLVRFKFTDFMSYNFSALINEAQNNIGTFINDDLYEDIFIIISVGMDGDLAKKMFEEFRAKRINENPIEKAPQIKLKIVALNEFAIVVLTRFFQELAERHESTRETLYEFNEFQLKASSEFGEKVASNDIREVPQQPQSRELDDWLIYRLEMMPFGVNIKIPEIAKKLPYDYESARKRSQKICRDLREEYGLDDFEISL